MNIVEAKALGLEELKRRKEAMSQDIDRDPNVWTVIVNAISELEWEAQQTKQHEERVQLSVVTLQNILDTASIEGFAIRDLCLDEARYQLLSIWAQEQFAAQAEEFSKQIQQEMAESKRLRDELADMQDKVEAKDAEINTLRSQNYQLTNENQQLNDYRDNAARIIEEKDAEIARLNDQVDDLRKEIAVGARAAIKVTNLEGAKVIAEQIRASLIPVIDIEEVDGRTIIVTHPDGRKEKDHPNYIRKYRKIGGEEAARFLEEQQAQLSTAASTEVVAEPVTFQIEPPEVELHGVHEGAAPADSGEARTDAEALGPVSREEFEALKFQVRRIERYVYNEPHTAEDDELGSRVRGA